MLSHIALFCFKNTFFVWWGDTGSFYAIGHGHKYVRFNTLLCYAVYLAQLVEAATGAEGSIQGILGLSLSEWDPHRASLEGTDI